MNANAEFERFFLIVGGSASISLKTSRGVCGPGEAAAAFFLTGMQAAFLQPEWAQAWLLLLADWTEDAVDANTRLARTLIDLLPIGQEVGP